MFQTIKGIVKHISCVQEALLYVVDEFRMRALTHDSSKFEQDELEGFARFENFPKGLEYKSPEYNKAMDEIMKDNPCFDLHCMRNDHHPEHFSVIPDPPGSIDDMRLFPLMEMVADWVGAHMAYGNKGDFRTGCLKNIEEHDFNPHQRWVINQMIDFFITRMPELKGEQNG